MTTKCLDNGILVNVAHGKTIRLVPPLIVTSEQTDAFTDLLGDLLS